MAQVQISRLGDGLLTLDAGGSDPMEFAHKVVEVTLKPDSSDSTYTLAGDSVTDEAWKLSGKLLPDFGDEGSLQEWCFTNRGKEMPFEFVPNLTKAKKLTGRATVAPVAIGGEVRANDRIDFEFKAVDVNIAAYAASSAASHG